MKAKVRSVPELETAIRNLLEKLLSEMQADAITFHYYDETHDRLILPVGVNLVQPRRFKSWLPSMDRVAGKIVKSSKPVIADDAEHHTDTTGPFVYAEGIKSAAGYPVTTTSGEKIGVLFVNYRVPHPFSPEERAFLKESVAQIADAIGEWLKKTSDLKIELSTLVGRRREEAALQEITDTVREVLGDVAVAIWTSKGRKGEMLIAAQSGMKEQVARDASLNLAQPGSVVNAFRTKSLVKGSAWEGESLPEDQAAAMRLKTVWAFPILSQSQALGVLCVYPIGYDDLTPREKTIAKAFAEQAAATVENHRRILTLTILNDIGRRLTVTLEDPQELMREIVASVAWGMGADSIALHQYDPSNQEFYTFDKSVTYGIKPYPSAEKPRDDGVSAYVVEHGLITIPDIDKADENLVRTPRVLEAGVKSYIGIRLKADETVVGVLFFNYNEKCEFSPDELTIATTFANYAAAAIHNSQIYRESVRRAERLDLVRQVAAAVSSARELDDILQLAVNGLAKVIGVKQSAVAVFDEVGEYADVRAEYLDPGCVPAMGHRIPLRDNPQIDKILETKRPLIVDDVPNNPIMAQIKDIMEERRTLSLMVAPIVIEDRVVGTIGIDAVDQKRRFTDEEANLAQVVADQAATAIQNARVYKQIQKRIQALEALNRVSQRLSTAKIAGEDLSHLLRQVAQQAREVLDADVVELYQYYPGREDSVAAHVSVGKRLSDTKPKEILPDDVVAKVLARKSPLFASDAQGEPFLSDPFKSSREGRPDERFVVREQIASTAAVPLWAGDKAVGVMFVNYRARQKFQSEQRELIHLFANQAATALYNARQDERLAALNEIGQTLTAGIRLRQDAILELIYEQAQKLTGAQDMYIALYDEETNMIRFGLAMEHGERVEYEPRKADMDERGKTEEVIFTQKPILHRTLEESTAWYGRPGHKEFIGRVQHSYLGVPLVAGEKVLGMIALSDWKRDHAYDERDLQVFSSMASQAAIALDNAALYYETNQQLESRVQALAALVEVGQALTSGIRLEQDAILELIYEQAQKLTGAQDMYIALYDEETNMIRFGLAMEHGERVEYEPRKADMDERGKTEEVIFTQKPILHRTLEESTAWYGRPGHKEFIGRVAPSWLGVPLVAGEKVLGMIALSDWKRDHAYDERDLQVFSSMASQAAIALDNATLYQRTDKHARQLETVRKITNAIATELDLQACMERILDETVELLGASYATIQLVDEATDELVIHVQRGTEGRILAPKLQRIKIGQGITGVVAQKGWTIRVGNVDEVDYSLNYIEDTKSEMATRLIEHEKVIGVLNVEDPRENAFDEDDEELFKLLAEEVVVAVQNARLFEEKDQALASLRKEQQKTIAAGRLAAVNAVTTGFVHRMNNVAGTIPVWVGQIKELLDPSDPRFPKMAHFLDAINEDVNGILKAAHEIRSSTSSTEPLELASIDTLVSTAIQRIAVPPGKAIDNQCENDLPSVLVFSGQLVDSLENIIRNGLEAIEKSGSVTIVSRVLKDDQEWVAIDVEDTGHGIPSKDLANLFDLFFSTKPGGMGFALWRAKTLVESMAGRISVSSEVGKGTTFTILLPVAEEVQR